MIEKYSPSLSLLLAIILHCFVVQAIIVKTKQGELKGREEISRAGNKYFSFRGIPYAKPPLGDLRFQDSQNPESWTGIRDAEEYASDCPQVGWITVEGIYGNEDCLYLNVFTPELENVGTSGLPVLFWIHGGSFVIGAGSRYGPEYFMDQPIVMVTVNYRLGALGFLHFDDDELKGNYGMKDQVMALRWVRNNIRAFGGDPQNVTIGGQSAGGACVHWHMFSTLSKGLFHRAISQSGTAMAVWAEVPKRIAKERGLILARLVGCNYESIPETVTCLRRVPAYELIKAQSKFSIWSYLPMSLAIVPENEDTSAWKSQTLDSNVPWLIGFTSNELEAEIASLVSKSGHDLENLGKLYQTFFPIILMYNVFPRIQTVIEMTKTTEKIKEFYFKNESIHRGTLKQLENLWADNFFTYDITEAALRHRGLTYLYVFDHLQEHSYTELENREYRPSGPVHCDDLTSLFNMSYFPQKLNSADANMSQLMINIWTNFIRTGNPNSDDLRFQWLPLRESNILFLSITRSPEMKPWYWEDRFAFWRDLNFRNESSK